MSSNCRELNCCGPNGRLLHTSGATIPEWMHALFCPKFSNAMHHFVRVVVYHPVTKLMVSWNSFP